MAYPAFQPTDEQRQVVLNGAMMGLSQDIIAKVIGISTNTLIKYFSEELTYGLDNLKIRAGKILWEKIEKGDTTALIFFLKTRAGFNEIKNVTIANTPGTTFKTTLDASNLTDEQLKAIASIKLNGE